MAGPIVHINGWPGTGKLTIARELARLLDARLLDNHSILDPAHALFDRRDPLHHSLRRSLRAAVFDHLRRMQPQTALLFTDALSEDAHDVAVFDEYRQLAGDRAAPLVAVVLDIDAERNLERLTAVGRSERHKLTNPKILAALRANHRLLRATGLPLVELDVSELSPAEAAGILSRHIATALESDPKPPSPTS
ncbi:AAA family ATPase [Bosea sp. BH3]|uniref:AAA family ATPase n=1 Tax=Bosea sp. BH3 TaxID=2871701 RepID=UPI0021CB19FD|nr:AAA family ATPase [Bosea sp. BH3]MCU4180537.1 AAA family ATPase [Bosea sp. BH3]